MDAEHRCLSVVMPCYNEENTVAAIVDRVLASPYTAELIIVDDGSTDATAEVLGRLVDPRVQVVVQPFNQGKGAALRTGFREARFPYVVVQDADEEYDPSDYDALLGPLLDGRADVVYGSRFHTARPHRVLYYWHSVGNRFLTTLSNMFTNINLSDMETCYKAFRREVIESFEIQEDRFGFEPEITAKVARGGWRIYEVSISYSGRTYAEGKKIGWKDGMWAFWCILRYSRVGERLFGPVRPHVPGDANADGIDEALQSSLESMESAVNYNAWIYSMLESALGHRVLEVGAGHGTLTSHLASGRSVTATETSDRCLAVLRRRFGDAPNVEIVAADIADVAGLGPFDAAVLVNVLEHVVDDDKALRRLRQVLVPGGRLLLFVPAFEALYSRFDASVGHCRRYSKAELAGAVRGAGFELIDLHYVNSAGAPAWWLMAKVFRRTPTSRWSAVAYDRVMVPVLRRMEQSWTPPFGQSLLCIARRPM